MLLKGFEHSVEAFLSSRRWYVAYSGGLDSQLLLHLLQDYLKRHLALEQSAAVTLPELIAVHVDHGLQAASADWARHCQASCAALGVPIIVRSLHLDAGSNVESRARDARYQVFAELLSAEDVIFLGHHQDDQLETFFYRLARGAGVHGLTAMPKQRILGAGRLVRPLLSYSRQSLQEYACQLALTWIEDPSNQLRHFDRNWLRHELIPLYQQRWPQLPQRIASTINHLCETDQLLAELAEADLVACDCDYSALWQEHRLGLNALLRLSVPRRKNLLRYWLESFGCSLTESQWPVLMQQLLPQTNDTAAQITLGKVVLRVFNGSLYAISSLASVAERQQGEHLTCLEWRGDTSLTITGWGQLRLSKPSSVMLRVQFRQGGERCRLPGRNHSHKLKSLLQEMQVPPWRRRRLPLIYYRGQLLAVADLLLCDGAVDVLGEGCFIIAEPQ